MSHLSSSFCIPLSSVLSMNSNSQSFGKMLFCSFILGTECVLLHNILSNTLDTKSISILRSWWCVVLLLYIIVTFNLIMCLYSFVWILQERNTVGVFRFFSNTENCMCSSHPKTWLRGLMSTIIAVIYEFRSRFCAFRS